jgi:fructokinase
MAKNDRTPQRLWVLGEALIDLVVRPGLFTQAQIGGAAVNLVRTAARLGVPSTYVGSISSDLFGHEILNSLRAAGADTGQIRLCDMPTTLAVVELNPFGSPTYRFHTENTSAPNLSSFSGLEWRRGDLVVSGGLALVLEPLAMATVSALEVASQEGLTVVIDVNCRTGAITDVDRYRGYVHRALRCARAVKVSDEDLFNLIVLGVLPGPDIAQASIQLLEFGPCLAWITHGASPTEILLSGSRGLSGSQGPSGAHRSVSRFEVGPEVVRDGELVDTVGAGDAFLGSLLAWWILHGDEQFEQDHGQLVAAAKVAHKVAAATCRRPGADPLSASELGELFGS